MSTRFQTLKILGFCCLSLRPICWKSCVCMFCILLSIPSSLYSLFANLEHPCISYFSYQGPRQVLIVLCVFLLRQQLGLSLTSLLFQKKKSPIKYLIGKMQQKCNCGQKMICWTSEQVSTLCMWSANIGKFSFVETLQKYWGLDVTYT